MDKDENECEYSESDQYWVQIRIKTKLAGSKGRNKTDLVTKVDTSVVQSKNRLDCGMAESAWTKDKDKNGSE